jgi:hypothetical protein
MELQILATTLVILNRTTPPISGYSLMIKELDSMIQETLKAIALGVKTGEDNHKVHTCLYMKK